MTTKQYAKIAIMNSFSATMRVHLYHWNSDYGLQQGAWTLRAGEASGFLTVYFSTGLGSLTEGDYWYVTASPVSDASGESWYCTTGTPNHPYSWAECQLQSGDAGDPVTFVISTSGFDMTALDSGGRVTGFNKFAGKMQLGGIYFTNIFVLMLENHSFDNMLAFSGIPGITAATTNDSNVVQGRFLAPTYSVKKGAPPSMGTDPGHEFQDVVEQLGGQGAQYSAGVYPTITMGGFAANYITSNDEKTGYPTVGEIDDIMSCFDTKTQLPVMYTLAKDFTVCDHWFSSMPGPTWPNRYFVHGASSSGLDDSPSEPQMAEWETVSGFTYPNGSLYQKLDKLGLYGYRLYRDPNGSDLGEIPQVCSLQSILYTDTDSVDNLASDLSWPYPYRFTFIEPNYGDSSSNTYTGGTSQHPMDSVAGGEGLIKKVYEAIRNSPLWEDSLLIITYDEHGGFYDSVAPGTCTAPNDNPSNGLNTWGFDFTQYGVRVPAIVISARTLAAVSTLTYDHASIPATVLTWLGDGSLTDRDKYATNLIALANGGSARTNCPTSLPNPAAPVPTPAPTPEQLEAIAQQPLPAKGNIRGFLAIAAKIEFELSSGTDEEKQRIMTNLQAIKTRGQAAEYMRWVVRRANHVADLRNAEAMTSRPQTVS